MICRLHRGKEGRKKRKKVATCRPFFASYAPFLHLRRGPLETHSRICYGAAWNYFTGSEEE